MTENVPATVVIPRANTFVGTYKGKAIRVSYNASRDLWEIRSTSGEILHACGSLPVVGWCLNEGPRNAVQVLEMLGKNPMHAFALMRAFGYSTHKRSDGAAVYVFPDLSAIVNHGDNWNAEL